jgi:hypothetical protein
MYIHNFRAFTYLRVSPQVSLHSLDWNNDVQFQNSNSSFVKSVEVTWTQGENERETKFMLLHIT